MESYFTNIAKNELKNHFFYHPMDGFFKPFQTTGDFISTGSSIVILPCKFFMLTLLSFAEATLSIGRAYFLKNNELEFNEYLAESKSSGDVGIHMMWMFLIIAPLMIAMFVLRFFVTLCVNQANEITPTQASNLISDTELDILQKKIKAVSEYSTLVENSDADISIIKEALERHHLEANAFLNTGKYPYHSNKKTLPSITMVSYFQVTEEQKALLMEGQRNTELLTAFQELMREYPPCSFEKSSTLEEIESACRLHEEHHAKVLNIAEVMLADLFGSLNKARLTSDGLHLVASF